MYIVYLFLIYASHFDLQYIKNKYISKYNEYTNNYNIENQLEIHIKINAYYSPSYKMNPGIHNIICVFGSSDETS